MIAARTTGAQSHTKKENIIITVLTVIILPHSGKNQNIKVVNITQRVILKPLTAIK